MKGLTTEKITSSIKRIPKAMAKSAPINESISMIMPQPYTQHNYLSIGN